MYRFWELHSTISEINRKDFIFIVKISANLYCDFRRTVINSKCICELSGFITFTQKDDLTDADFSRLPQFTTFSQEPIEYWFRQGAGPTTLVNDSTELGLLYNYLNIAREFSNGLYASNIFSMDDINLQELVIKIKNCSLMVSTENLYLNKQLPISLPHLRKGVLDFYQLYLQLSEYAAVKGITIKGDISEGSVPIVYT